MATTDTHVIGDYTAAITIDGSAHYLLIQPGSNSTAYKKINRNVFLGVTGQPADISTVQSFTNKTLDNTNIISVRDDRFTIQDSGDTTKQAQFQLSGLTTGATRTYTLPNRSDTLVDLGSSQTLTSKTLTSPVITGGSIDNTTITVDSITGHTSATTGTVYGITVTAGTISSAALASNAVTTIKIADSAVTPAKLTAGAGSTWVWQAWTPTFTNWTIGTGGSANTTATYCQIGKTVFFRISSVLGSSGQSVGNNPTFTMPVTATSHTSAVFPIGTMAVTNGGNAHNGWVTWATTTTVALRTWDVNNDQGAVTSTTPFTWAAGGAFFAEGFYEAA